MSALIAAEEVWAKPHAAAEESPLGGGLWEVQSNLTQGRIVRVIFYASEGCIVLLPGFVKKTPPPDLELACRRQKEVER